MEDKNSELPIRSETKSDTKKIQVDFKAEQLGDSENNRIEYLRKSIDEYYENIPISLRDLPDAQGKCLELLSDAEQQLTPPVSRKNIIDARLDIVRIEIEIRGLQISRMSFSVVAVIVYVFAIAVGGIFYAGVIIPGVGAKELNTQLIMGIPLPILIWGVIGSFTSMLFRAGYFPFTDRSEAYRWLLFRPIVGVVMGVLTYLMVTAGLIVFAGNANTQTPELLWIIAFVGSFSDNLSINLLQKVLGKFHVEKVSENINEKDQSESNK